MDLNGNIQNPHHTHKWNKLSKRFKEAHYGLCADPFGIHSQKVVPCAHVHHILPLEHYPQYFFYWSNLICLCEDCHNIAHRLYEQSPSAYFAAFKKNVDKLQRFLNAQVVLKQGGSKKNKKNPKITIQRGPDSNIFAIFDNGGVKIEGGVLKF